MIVAVERNDGLIEIVLIGKNNDALKMTEDDSCVLCLDSMNTEEPRVLLKCNHVYHAECFKSYVDFNLRRGRGVEVLCPICRETVFNNTETHLKTEPVAREISTIVVSHTPLPPPYTAPENMERRIAEDVCCTGGYICYRLLIAFAVFMVGFVGAFMIGF